MAALNWTSPISDLVRAKNWGAKRLSIILGVLCWMTTLVTYAAEVTLNENARIGEGKGWVVFSMDAPNPGELVYSVVYKSTGKASPYKDTFSYGKSSIFFERAPNLVSQYGLPYNGRLVAIELEPGQYVLDTVTIQSAQDLLKLGNPKTPDAVLLMRPGSVRTSDGTLNVRFNVEQGKAKYLGHWTLEVGDTTNRAGTYVGILLLGFDFGGFSLNFKVADKYEDVRKIFSEKVPLVHADLMTSLVKSAVVTRNFHPLEKYPETAYARLDDFAAVPVHDSENCVRQYENWLKQKPPRAFAVGVHKGCGFSWGNQPKNPEDSPIPAERVIAACERTNGPCLLYAVDDRVVYRKPD